MGKKTAAPERGDILMVDFDPTVGHEQAGHRPALVLSPRVFNERVGLAIVAPITSTVRGHGLEVAVETATTKGVALIQQVTSIDFRARDAQPRDKASSKTVGEALAKARMIFQD